MLAVQPIDSCWKESILAFPAHSYDIGITADYPVTLKVATLLCCALLIAFVGIVLEAISISFKTFFQGRKIREAEYNQTHLISINTTFAISMALLSIIFYKNLDTRLTYLQMLLLFASTAFCRKILNLIASWISEKRETVATASLSFRIHAIVFTTMLMPLVALRVIWPQIEMMVTTCYIILIFITTYIPYIYQLINFFIADNCSLFFKILYLCEVELFTIGFFIIAIFTL